MLFPPKLHTLTIRLALSSTSVLDEEDCPVGDKKNMVFAGSQVTKGRLYRNGH
jgi:hypothetical protein